ncbi:MAG TPA: CHAD domain-containing protein [Terriglobales bacterium]|nr:CHAD domain-containing protein [Terriglobales bacterium]
MVAMVGMAARPIPISTAVRRKPVKVEAGLSTSRLAKSKLATSQLAKSEVAKPKLGLRAWMERVPVECDRAAAGFEADPVHDLRVALRRCRSLADGLIALDPDASWKEMKKAGKRLFQALGELRDMQVMEEWIEKLGFAENAAGIAAGDGADGVAGDPVAGRLLNHIHAREAECKVRAFKDLNQFDRKQWRQWTRALPHRAARVRPGSAVYLHLALEKWTAGYELHKHALRTRSQASWHALRIGIKRFRYTVENFLPQQHELWGSDLKELQDLLGDVHDLDVLWATAVEIMAFPDIEHQRRWREKLNTERAKRIDRYREKMVGKQSLWQAWRGELPAGAQLRAAAMSRLRVWAGYVDPDFAHSLRVAQMALLLYDGLRAAGLLSGDAAVGWDHVTDGQIRESRAGDDSGRDHDPRAVLQAAALLHDVGKAKGAANHQKASYRMIRGLSLPLGWSARELQLAAVVARYHRGALPRPRAKTMQMLELTDRAMATEAAGILRLANALDAHHGQSGNEHRANEHRGNEHRGNEHVVRERTASSARAVGLEVELRDSAVVVRVAGYSPLDRSAEGIAAARHLLETVLRRPVIVRALRSPATGRQPARRMGLAGS